MFLIPNVIAEQTHHRVITSQCREVLPGIRHFLAEDVRTARRFLSSLKVYDTIESLHFSVLDKDTVAANVDELMRPAHEGFDVGVISESGCPGVADPGALAVHYCHRHKIQVVPLVGPSSLLLALMASGLNGQKFAFHGYLPIDSKELSRQVKHLEEESRKNQQTQIIIETPFRNNQVLKSLTNTLGPATDLCIALDITGSDESIKTRTVREWRMQSIEIPKKPAVYLFLAH
ncbi:MAG TPA: SAM-dependent methyltransferase [Chryseosolibacter sp.]